MACRPVLLRSGVSRTEAGALAAAFKVIADPARVQLLAFLATQPGGEACVCHLTAPVGLSQPTVSHHLRVLHRAGFVARERRGVWVYYRLRPERLEALRTALALPARPGRRPAPGRAANRGR